MSQNTLMEYFGHLLIKAGRDKTIANFDKLLQSGKDDKVMGGKYKPMLDTLDDMQMVQLRSLAIWLVDTTLHNVMFMFEETDNIRISVEHNNVEIKDIRKASDGLHGDIYSWAEEYSKEPLSNV